MLVIKAVDGKADLECSLLIHKGDCYVYCFMANGKWQNVQRSAYNLFDEDGNSVERVHFGTHYTGAAYQALGKSTIVRALPNLQNKNPKMWQDNYLHLVFVFIEAVRFHEIFYFVREALSKSIPRHFHEKPTTAYHGRLIHSWGTLSGALDVHSKTGTWFLPGDTVSRLNLPAAESEQIAKVRGLLAITKLASIPWEA